MRPKMPRVALRWMWAVALYALAALPLSLFAQSTTPLNSGFRSPEEHYNNIVSLDFREFHDMVEAEAREFLQRYPQHALARECAQRRIHALEKLQRPAEAIQAIDDYLKRYPKDSLRPQYLLLQAQMLHQQGQSQAAEKRLQELLAIKKHANDDDALYLLAQVLEKLQRPEEVRQCYEKLAQKKLATNKPLRLSAVLYLAQLMYTQGDYDGALKHCQALLALRGLEEKYRRPTLSIAAAIAFSHLRDYSLANNYYGALTIEFPTTQDATAAKKMLLDCSFQLKDFTMYLERFKSYRRENPQANLELRYLEWCVLACEKLQRHQEKLYWITAILFRSNLSAEQRSYYSWARFVTQVQLRQFKLAYESGQQFLKDSTASSPYTPELLNLLGYVAQQLQKPEEALDYYRQALPLFVADQEKYLSLTSEIARILEAKKEYAQAAAVLLEAVPKAPREKQPQLLHGAAQYAYHAKDYELCRQQVEVLLANFQDSPQIKIDAWNLKFHALNAQNQHQPALATARELAANTQGKAKAQWLYYCGSLEYNFEKDLAKAAESFQSLLAIPETPLSQRTAATQMLLYLRLQLKQPVADVLKQALQLPPEAQKGIPPALLISAAEKVRLAGEATLAQQCWEALLSHPRLTAKDRTRVRFLLAESIRHTAPDQCRQQLLSLQQELGEEQRSANADALLALLALDKQDFLNAWPLANNSLDKPEQLLPRSRARAWWVLAKFFYHSEKNLQRARSYATRIYTEKERDPEFTPLALALCAEIYRQEGKEEIAKELLQELQRDYPSFTIPGEASTPSAK